MMLQSTCRFIRLTSMPELDIDMVAVRKIARQIDARTVFLVPPSMAVLEERLRGRGTETEESLAVRLRNAEEEIRQAKELPVDRYLCAPTTSAAWDELRPTLFDWYPDLRRRAEGG